MQKSAITVSSALPPDQQDREKPFEAIVANMSGYREPPPEDEEGAEPDAAARFQAVEVTQANYNEVFGTVWKPRIKIKVPDVLTGDADRTIDVDVSFKSRTGKWPGDLDTENPELRGLNSLIRELERLQSQLSRQTALRDRVEGMMRAAIAAPDDTAKPSADATKQTKKK